MRFIWMFGILANAKWSAFAWKECTADSGFVPWLTVLVTSVMLGVCWWKYDKTMERDFIKRLRVQAAEVSRSEIARLNGER